MLLARRPLMRRGVLVSVLVCMPALAVAQALPGISSLRVPCNMRPRQDPAPLVIALQGLGGSEDSMFDACAKQAVALAEQHGFLTASPTKVPPPTS
jgi:hypothetical protein